MTPKHTLASSLDLLTEDMLTLSEVARELPSRPHVSTVWRFARRGIGGQKLETVKIGSRVFSSRQAVTRFLEATQRTE